MQQSNQYSLQAVIAIARQAGEEILAIYRQREQWEVTHKADDSPLTAADLAAHHAIEAGLKCLTPDVPVLSEESGLPDWETRRQWQRYWLVDPLDGTKEFVGGNGEFTVNIALIENGRPVLGVVYVPVQEVTYSARVGEGAWKQVGKAAVQSLRTRPVQSGGPVTVVASRRHRGKALDDCLQRIEQQVGPVEATSMGSSLKLCLVAEGKADLYPRLAPTSEWDTAAAQAVVEAAGGQVVDTAFQPLRYNQQADILNPWFYVLGDSQFDWQTVLSSKFNE